MKFAILALAGSIAMGASIIADTMGRSDDLAKFYAGAGFVVMTLAALAIIAPLILDQLKARSSSSQVPQADK